MKMLKSLLLLGVAATLVAGTAYLAGAEGEATKEEAPQAEFIGSAKCKACHMKGDVYKVWEGSPHAKATEVLPAESKADGTCLACHSTGFGKAGGYDPKAEANVGLEGVGCEMCHGAGSEYKTVHMKDKAKAAELGLKKPVADDCKVCHAGKVPEGHKALPEFKYEAAWAKIAHKLPAKEEAK